MFSLVKKAFQDNFALLIAGGKKIYVSDVDKDELWNTYLESFPENERQGHNCNSCKSFIRHYGNLVVINGGNMQSIWEGMNVGNPFNEIFDALAIKVGQSKIRDIFVTKEAKLGTTQNRATDKEGNITTWHHFALEVPKSYVDKSSLSVEAVQGTARDDRNVLKRSLDEISLDTIDTVLELIAQNSLYRGQEFKGILDSFRKTKLQYALYEDKELNSWSLAETGGAVTRIRNTSIGTLLVNIAEGMDLDKAVAAFESIMAPANYKRPTALVTKRMIEDAEKKIAELGLTDSLGRKYATPDDVNVNNVLFVDRDAKKATGIFAELKEEANINPKTFSKVEEVAMDKFLKDIMPKADSIEVFLENRHKSNFVSLIAPKDSGAKSLFKWANGFSWSYQDGMADGLKERVKAAGGRVDGVFRFTHSWNELEPNQSLMDLHVFMPGNEHTDTKVHNTYGSGRRVGWNCRTDSASGGIQDVDYVSEAPVGYIPVENITFPSVSKMPEGKYICKVHNWSYRKSGGKGRAQIAIGNESYDYVYPATKHHEWITIAEVTLKGGMFTIEHKIEPGASSSIEIWGLNTNRFHKVSSIMKSPNFWNGERIGNEHLFFMIEGAKTTGARGFFNEFLSDELLTHKRVFEALGNKLKVEESDKQLNGLGFSSTVQGDVFVRVTGKFSRIIKIKF